MTLVSDDSLKLYRTVPCTLADMHSKYMSQNFIIYSPSCCPKIKVLYLNQWFYVEPLTSMEQFHWSKVEKGSLDYLNVLENGYFKNQLLNDCLGNLDWLF